MKNFILGLLSELMVPKHKLYFGGSQMNLVWSSQETSNLEVFTVWLVKEVCVCAQLCPTLRNPMDSSLPGSSVRGILQVRILEWVAISYSRGSSPPRD